MDTIKVIITEDEPFFREMLRRILSDEQQIEVVGTATSGSESVSLARQVKPDVCIMDIELDGQMDGIEAALMIKKGSPDTGIVILSSHNDRHYISSLPLESISGWAYLLKQTLPNIEELVRAIEGSKAGMVILDPEVISNLQPMADSPVSNLTSRQMDVLTLLASGYSNMAIAKKLVLQEKSVETYVNAIYRELRISNEPEAHARVKATLIFLDSTQKHLP